MEEVWQNLIESNVLVQNAGGGWDIDRAAPEIVIPASVKDVIDQRVERLAETARRSLGRASVIGREFDFKVLERIAGIEEDELLDAIDDGLAAQLLVEAPPVEDRYSFAHALIRETLYEQQSSARRRRLHRRIGEAIEGLHAGDLDGQLPALARHFAKAGGDPVSKAVDYGMQAGQQAMEQAAYEQAEEHLVRSLDLLGAMPDTPELIGMEIGLQVMRGPGLMALKGCGCGEMEEAYARAWDLGQKLGDHPDMAPVLWGMWIYNYTHARLDKALDLAQRLDAMAQSAGGSDGLLHSSHSLWATLFFRGDLAAAESYLQRGRELYDPDRGVVDVLRYGGHDAGMCSRIFGSLSAWMHGDVERSRQLEAEGLELAGEMSPINAAFALDWAAVRHQMDGDHEAAGTLSARAIDLATRRSARAVAGHGPHAPRVGAGRRRRPGGRDRTAQDGARALGRDVRVGTALLPRPARRCAGARRTPGRGARHAWRGDRARGLGRRAVVGGGAAPDAGRAAGEVRERGEHGGRPGVAPSGGGRGRPGGAGAGGARRGRA